MFDINSFKNDLEKIKNTKPLIHNITNYVAMNNTANALLAIGASPAMLHDRNEVTEFVALCNALVINIGTLDLNWVESMLSAGKVALHKNIPLIFDPVGCGITSIRNVVCSQIIKECKPNVIRANASEIRALNNISFDVRNVNNPSIGASFIIDDNAPTTNTTNFSKGVDSMISSDQALEAAKNLAKKLSCIIVVSGATDYITDGNDINTIKNGHILMTKVTAIGCSATAIIASFAAVNSNFLEASTHAMAAIAIAGQLAAKRSRGPGSMQVNIIDELYLLNYKTVRRYLKQ